MIIDSCWIVDEVNFEMRGALADMNTNMNMATMSPIMLARNQNSNCYSDCSC